MDAPPDVQDILDMLGVGDQWDHETGHVWLGNIMRKREHWFFFIDGTDMVQWHGLTPVMRGTQGIKVIAQPVDDALVVVITVPKKNLSKGRIGRWMHAACGGTVKDHMDELNTRDIIFLTHRFEAKWFANMLEEAPLPN